MYLGRILVLLLPIQCLAWGNLGHQTVALLAHKYLTPEGASYVSRKLGSTNIQDAAIWADDYKNTLEGKKTMSWHFVDAHDDPPHSCNVLMSRDCHAEETSKWCILKALDYVQSTLTNTDTSLHKQALMFLIHLVGDLHHPLHVESIARGGNDINVKFEDENLSLHFVWDVSIPHKIVQNIGLDEKSAPEAWASRLYDGKAELYAGNTDCLALVRQGLTPPYCELMEPLTPNKSTAVLEWARETNQLVCSYVLRDGMDSIRDQELAGEYFEGSVSIVEGLIIKAARRLAVWINGLGAQDGA